jgi:hypothetical protein
MTNWAAAMWRRWSIWRYRDRQAAEERVDRRSAEHIERLENGIKDSPRGPGAAM